MKKRLIASIAMASVLFGTTGLYAKSGGVDNAPRNKQVKTSVTKEVHNQYKKFKAAPKEIVIGLNDTFEAVRALQQKNTKLAEKKLSEATKMFDVALKANPNLGLMPVANDVQVNELDNTLKQIKTDLKLAKISLNNHDIQTTLEMLAPLRDDITITTRFIPMDIYPVMTKKAFDQLNKGHKGMALETLFSGLHTLIAERVIIPIPLLGASDLVKAASKLDKKNKKKALALLSDARVELNKAYFLGYANPNMADYKAISDQIKAIQKEIKGKNRVEKLYSHANALFESLLTKTKESRAHARARAEENTDMSNFKTKEKDNIF